MGPGRPRHLVIGLVLVLVVLWDRGAAAAQAPLPTVVHGDVAADGASLGSVVTHLAKGTYRIQLPRSEVRLDVRSWDEVADVTIVPMGHGANEVRFSVGGHPIDSAFAFVAVAMR